MWQNLSRDIDCLKCLKAVHAQSCIVKLIATNSIIQTLKSPHFLVEVVSESASV